MVGIWLFRPKAALNFYIFCGKAFLLGPFWLKEKHCSALISNVSLVTIICTRSSCHEHNCDRCLPFLVVTETAGVVRSFCRGLLCRRVSTCAGRLWRWPSATRRAISHLREPLAPAFLVQHTALNPEDVADSTPVVASPVTLMPPK
jgi:hypothetical protein